MADEPGLKIPLPGKDFRPMRRESNVWPSNGLTGAMTEYRTVQDFGAPNGWPPHAPTSATKTTSATAPAKTSESDAEMGVSTAIGIGPRLRKNPAR